MIYLYGPEAGRRHDMTLYRKLGLDQALKQHAVADGEQFYVYSNAAFIMRPWHRITFDKAVETIEQSVFNAAMSSARESGKCSYKPVKQ